MKSRLHAYFGTFRQMEVILTLFETGTVHATADTLHLTQPTVSQQLKKLRDVIGLPIYEQVGRKLVFTDVGLALVNTARDILQSCEQLDMKLSQFKGVTAGTLRISVVTTAKYFIPHLLGTFCAHYPGVDIKFKVGNRQQIIDRVNDGIDDFYVFSHVPEGPELEVMPIVDNPLVAIAPRHSKWHVEQEISLAEFAKMPFIIRESGSGTRHAIESFMRAHNIDLNIRMTIESNEAIKHTVMSGFGVSILSSHTLAVGESTNIALLKVHSLPITTQWSFVWRRKKLLTPVADAFLQYMNSEGKNRLLQGFQFLSPD
ncbi:MAG: LysR family transcriptional regulator [Aestuariibacter sp.]